MDVIPIAEESLGVRSMAMFIKTRDLSILLDPGISLSPNRFGLPPHPRELERVRTLRSILERYSEETNYVFISHYHRDHFTVPYPSIYMGTTNESYRKIYSNKVLLLKSPDDENWSQRRRYYGLRRAIEGLVREIMFVDGRELTIGSTKLVISQSLPHGEDNARTGKVIAITIINNDESLTFMPDVEGPVSQLAVNYIMAIRPQTLIVGGPPLYLSRKGFGEDYLNNALRNLMSILRAGFLDRLVIAHHTLRELNWRNALKALFEDASKYNISIITYAGMLDREDELLEAMRKELYAAEPPPKDYLKQFRGVKDENED
ncbi:hypothetical protein VMUT_0768 [Vulcanisaeta moutnovskia 768-28]|uniref:UPF0282 protein VMUT_0768 n=1 Tax=Vulcanisaeta moutnovskia (strain 768-28) TaxID=985053 RepID=F0QWD1_VULM7|nr:hypothetical protein [Vulcanisaeta moutnovskia]ADY00979.1 hypothetical protein VMUT_0768 [Vulcanisaeta moutnovskia 768-28]